MQANLRLNRPSGLLSLLVQAATPISDFTHAFSVDILVHVIKIDNNFRFSLPLTWRRLHLTRELRGLKFSSVIAPGLDIADIARLWIMVQPVLARVSVIVEGDILGLNVSVHFAGELLSQTEVLRSNLVVFDNDDLLLAIDLAELNGAELGLGFDLTQLLLREHLCQSMLCSPHELNPTDYLELFLDHLIGSVRQLITAGVSQSAARKQALQAELDAGEEANI
jgi:hypothetical protein